MDANLPPVGDKETAMKAIRIHKLEGFEGIDGLVYEDAPDRQPAIGDALVEVRAASFTPTELTWPLQTDRDGHDRGARIPAHEGSGVVVALGYGTAGVSVGDEVYGLIDGYRSPAIVKPGGSLVSVMNPQPTDRDDIRVVHFVRDASGAQLREITRLVDQGIVQPQVGAVYALADAREAFMAKSTRHIPGKVVLTP
jgi:NADPH:quinone reductase-like Zn-dependent oxidoreductase